MSEREIANRALSDEDIFGKCDRLPDLPLIVGGKVTPKIRERLTGFMSEQAKRLTTENRKVPNFPSEPNVS